MPTDVRWWTFATNLFFNLLNGCKSDKIMENNLQTGDVVDNEGPLIFTKWERTSVWWWTTASLTFCWSHIGGKTKIKFPCHNSDSSRLRKKTFPRTSDESRKHRLCFPIGRGKNILPLDCFSSWSPPPVPLVVFFPASAAAANTRGGSTNFMLCKNGSDSLWPFTAPSWMFALFSTSLHKRNVMSTMKTTWKKKKRKENAGENVTTSWGAEEFGASSEKHVAVNYRIHRDSAHQRCDISVSIGVVLWTASLLPHASVVFSIEQSEFQPLYLLTVLYICSCFYFAWLLIFFLFHWFTAFQTGPKYSFCKADMSIKFLES